MVYRLSAKLRSPRNQALIAAVWDGYYLQEDGTLVHGQGRPFKPRSDKRGNYGFPYTFEGRQYHIHAIKLAAYIMWGEEIFDPSFIAEHINGDTSDNRWENLRLLPARLEDTDE